MKTATISDSNIYSALDWLCQKVDMSWGGYFNLMKHPKRDVVNLPMKFELVPSGTKQPNHVFILGLRSHDEVINEYGAIAFLFRENSKGKHYLHAVKVVDPLTLADYYFSKRGWDAFRDFNEIIERLDKLNTSLATRLVKIRDCIIESGGTKDIDVHADEIE